MAAIAFNFAAQNNQHAKNDRIMKNELPFMRNQQRRSASRPAFDMPLAAIYLMGATVIALMIRSLL